MLCDICGQDGARIRRVTETYGKGKNLLLIEQVPMVSCPSCGEETEVYTRIVGYYRPVKNWNLGKKSEYAERKTFDMVKGEIVEPEKSEAEYAKSYSAKEDEACGVT